jgi:tetratricopeptide (TPR) repeat protein
MFLRFYLSDGSYLNWDPNDAEVISDGDYQREYGASETEIRSGRYLRPLSNRELAGYFHMIRGKQFENRGLWGKAEQDYWKAIELFPQHASSRNALAWMYLKVQELRSSHVKDAVRLAEEAVQCEPGKANFLDTLAYAYSFDNRPREASEIEEKAAQLPSKKADQEVFQQRAELFRKGKTPKLKEAKMPDLGPLDF